ncbi:MAG: cbb3-type cytochrome oxidase assembly protein CcoS [Chromatocurvus sp.]
MDSLYLLIPIALIFCVIAIRLLLWAIDDGQYEDLDKESWRILADDDVNKAPVDRQDKAGGAQEDTRSG